MSDTPFPDEAHRTIEGEYTNAATAAEVEDMTEQFLRDMTNHPGFETPIRVMPDAHPEPNSRTVIGFTAPYNGKVSPNVVSPDIGCGMESWCFGDDLGSELPELDTEIRDAVPMGQGVMNTGGYHLGDQFDWDGLDEKLDYLVESLGELGIDTNAVTDHLPNGEYDLDYLKDLCARVGYSITDAINGIGSLGEGNHFIEVARSEATGRYWVTIHSGSRGIGYAVNDYWMDVATKRIHRAAEATRVRDHLGEYPPELFTRDAEELDDETLLSWVQGGLGEDFVDMQAVREKFAEDTDAIEPVRTAIKSVLPIDVGGNPYDYLEGEGSVGYLVDMLFCQHYALENRREMMRRVEGVIGVSHIDEIRSPHNYIDPEDMTVRKGATPARNGERGVVPLNMRDGVLIVRGKGSEEWNYSAPHGAGRSRSRNESREMLTLSDFAEAMDGIYSSSIEEYTIDEAPEAYKEAAFIVENIGPMAEVTDKLLPVLSMKAHAPPWFHTDDE